jgi:predicted Zn-dependent protease
MSSQTIPTPQEIVEAGLVAAAGVKDCVVIVTCTAIANVRWARTTLTTNGETFSVSAAVVAIVDVDGGTAAGSVTGQIDSAQDVDRLVEAAIGAARQAGPADDAADLPESLSTADWSKAPGLATSDELADVTPALGRIFVEARKDGIEHFGYAEQAVITTYVGTSSGTRARFEGPEGRLELTAKSHGRSRSAWAGRSGRRLSEIDVAGADAELRQGLEWQANRVEIEPGRHTAVLSPSATADLIIDLYWSSMARDAAEGRSVWSKHGGGTRIGDVVGDARITLSSDPSWEGLEAIPFATAVASSAASSVFDNGLPLNPITWIEQGVLRNLISTRATAKESQVPLAVAVDNLRMDVDGGHGSIADVVARVEDGLLITCLWYNRVVDAQTLLLTGLTRDGVYVIRGGKVIGAATNFRFNDSPVDILTRIIDAGDTVPTLAREFGDYFNRAAMPPLVVQGYNFSTVSQAS